MKPRSTYFIYVSLVLLGLSIGGALGRTTAPKYKLGTFRQIYFAPAEQSPVVEKLAEEKLRHVWEIYPHVLVGELGGMRGWCEEKWHEQMKQEGEDRPPQALSILGCIDSQVKAADQNRLTVRVEPTPEPQWNPVVLAPPKTAPKEI